MIVGLREAYNKAISNIKPKNTDRITQLRHNILKVVSSMDSVSGIKLISVNLKVSPDYHVLSYNIEGNIIDIFHTLNDCLKALTVPVFCRLVNLNFRGSVKYLIAVGHTAEDKTDIIDCNILISQVGHYTLGTSTDQFRHNVVNFLNDVSEPVSICTILSHSYKKPVIFYYEEGEPVYYGLNDLGEIEVQINVSNEDEVLEEGLE